MQFNCPKLTAILFVSGCTLALAKMTPEQVLTLPPPASHPVEFGKEIKPIFEASCVKCHGRGKAKGSFSLENRAAFLKGGDSGSAVVPGQSTNSYLIELVAGIDPDNVMPQKGSKLTSIQVGLLRAWIDQGLLWDESVTFAKPRPANFTPRRPELPAARAAASHPIDVLLQSYFEKQKTTPPEPVTDPVFARRVYLDVLGLPPTPEELEQFIADPRPNKRERLVRFLLARPEDRSKVAYQSAALVQRRAENRHRYAQHWLAFWNDLLRNYYKGPGDIDAGRKPITGWLYSALATNLSYDQFVAQLVNPNEYSEGFARGIVWRGVVNASQTPQMQVAQNISQVFMGVNLKCASCHDSFINDWALSDAYGLAGIYADAPLEMFQCDKPTGKTAALKFLYPELGEIDPKAPKAERLRQLAEIITKRENGRLTRTVVNRLWARLMGRGLVEPVDEMENPAWHPDLLDWLAEDLVDHDFDLKHTLEIILTSRAYQLPTVKPNEEAGSSFVFGGPVVRRLSAEQFVDAVAALTGVWHLLPASTDFNLSAGQTPGTESSPPVSPKWIWKNADASRTAEAETIYLRKAVYFSDIPAAAAMVAACDNSFTLYINGKSVTSNSELQKPKMVDIRSYLSQGTNVFAVAAANASVSKPEKGDPPDNPAGFWLYAYVRGSRGTTPENAESAWDFGSDHSWLWSAAKADQWEKPEFAATNWAAAVEIGEVDAAPWNLQQKLKPAMTCVAQYGHVRASLVNADPLLTALGCPNREQVTTSRPSAATTLQGLELTNGATLAEQLKRGAERWVKQQPSSGRDLAVRLYRQGLGRPPTAEELRLAEELIGSPVQQEGVEDFLWAMTMLPEFQLIY
ncbi:MAG: DUF1553 domain-containing protein [Verrucomicrobiota bacterium]